MLTNSHFFNRYIEQDLVNWEGVDFCNAIHIYSIEIQTEQRRIIERKKQET